MALGLWRAQHYAGEPLPKKEVRSKINKKKILYNYGS